MLSHDKEQLPELGFATAYQSLRQKEGEDNMRQMARYHAALCCAALLVACGGSPSSPSNSNNSSGKQGGGSSDTSTPACQSGYPCTISGNLSPGVSTSYKMKAPAAGQRVRVRVVNSKTNSPGLT